MSQRTHFWLRIVGIAVIAALELGPRLWTSSPLPVPVRSASVASAR